MTVDSRHLVDHYLSPATVDCRLSFQLLYIKEWSLNDLVHQLLSSGAFVKRPFDKCNPLQRTEMSTAFSYVAYYRVSTQKQGQSGLGLEAQQAAVYAFVGSSTGLLAEFTEVESGRNNRRPQLLAAVDLAREHGAVLLVAKLDRLARNVAFLATLMESRVRFKAVDVPQADEFTIHILAAVAQREAEAISQRTCAALAAKKARGFQYPAQPH